MLQHSEVCLLTFLSSAAAASPSGTSGVTVNVVQSVAFASPSTPTHAPPAPVPQTQPAVPPKPQVCVVGPGLCPDSAPGAVMMQQRLDQTSTSLEAALKAVERKLTLDDTSDG